MLQIPKIHCKFAVRNNMMVSHPEESRLSAQRNLGLFFMPKSHNAVIGDCRILAVFCSSEWIIVLFRDGIWQPSFLIAYNAKQHNENGK